MKRMLLPVLGAVVLASCATRPVPVQSDYVAPTSGDLAKLQVRSSPFAGYGVLYSFDNQRACAGNRVITNARASQLKASTALKADEPASLWFAYLGPGNRLCNVMLTFKPGKDKNYLAQVGATELACAIALQDITDPSNPKPESTRVLRTYQATAQRENPHCAPIDVDAELARARRPNLSQLRMDDLKALLPPADKKN